MGCLLRKPLVGPWTGLFIMQLILLIILITQINFTH